MKKPNRVFSLLSFLLLLSLTLNVEAQTESIFSSGLILPNKIITAGEHSLLVSETGTFTPNTGRISIVDRTTGDRATLIDGLPSGVNDLGGPPAPNGPSGLALHGHTLYVSISSGDAVQTAEAPGHEAPNPNPSSPLFDSVLELTLPGNYEDLASGFTLQFAHHATLAAGETVMLANTNSQNMSIRMIANLPDYVAEPLGDDADNVRASNLYGLELYRTSLYVVDASLNLLYKVNIEDGQYSVFAVFPPIAIPDGPTVEAVPDNVHRVGNKLLIALLTGFPFPAEGAEIRRVSLQDASQETFIPALTTAIDVLHVDEDDSYFTLEFSMDFLSGAPGRLRYYSTPNAPAVDITSTLITPTSMARDEQTGDIFVTNIFPGLITRVTDLQ